MEDMKTMEYEQAIHAKCLHGVSMVEECVDCTMAIEGIEIPNIAQYRCTNPGIESVINALAILRLKARLHRAEAKLASLRDFVNSL